MRLQSVCWVERSSDVPETNLLLITLTTVTAYVLSSGCAWVRPYSATSSLPPCLITVKTGMVKYAQCHISTKWWGQGSNPGWVQITNVLVCSLPVQHHPWPGTSTGSTEPWTATWAVTALSHDDDRGVSEELLLGKSRPRTCKTGWRSRGSPKFTGSVVSVSHLSLAGKAGLALLWGWVTPAPVASSYGSHIA